MFDLKWADANFPELKEKRGQLDAKRTSLAAVFTEAGPTLDASKVTSVKVQDGTALREVIAAANDELNALSQDVNALIGVAQAAYNVRHSDGPSPAAESGAGSDATGLTRAARTSIGDAFIASDAFKGYRPGSGVGPSVSLDVDIRATLFESAAGWDPQELRTGHVEFIATRPAPHVVEFIPQTETTQAAIVYMEETTFTNNAAEASPGGTYGEAALVLTEKTSTVRKVAVFIPVTDEQFEDVPRARDYVNNRLRFMLAQRLDSQVLVGNGTAPNLLGTENVSGIQSQALGTDPIPDAIFKAMRLIRDDGFGEPSVVFIRPSKWETVRLLRSADGVYIWGHPATMGPDTIWGVPVVQTTAPTATKAVIGDYRSFSELAVKRGVDVQVTNSHGTYFVEGKLAVRADVRLALVHYRPKCFAVVTGL